jgi:hypothetical protein
MLHIDLHISVIFDTCLCTYFAFWYCIKIRDLFIMVWLPGLRYKRHFNLSPRSRNTSICLIGSEYVWQIWSKIFHFILQKCTYSICPWWFKCAKIVDSPLYFGLTINILAWFQSSLFILHELAPGFNCSWPSSDQLIGLQSGNLTLHNLVCNPEIWLCIIPAEPCLQSECDQKVVSSSLTYESLVSP